MKLYLSYMEKFNKKADFILFCQQDHNVSNLDEYIDNGELDELYVDNCLSKFAIEDFEKIINNWLSKLHKTATITIDDVDARLIAKNFLKNTSNILEFSNFICHNKSAVTIFELESFLRNKGLKILEKNIDGFRFKIKAEKC